MHLQHLGAVDKDCIVEDGEDEEVDGCQYCILVYTKIVDSVNDLNACADWLVKLPISSAIYIRATREKMSSRFVSMTSEEIIQINLFVMYIISLF